jgi:hypothetical protein
MDVYVQMSSDKKPRRGSLLWNAFPVSRHLAAARLRLRKTTTAHKQLKSNARTYSGLFAQFLSVYLHASA